MSKKQKLQQKAPNDVPIPLPNLKVAELVVVALPVGIIVGKQQSQPLLEEYIRNKLNRKKLSLGQHFVALLKGREETFQIVEIDHSAYGGEMDEETKQ